MEGDDSPREGRPRRLFNPLYAHRALECSAHDQNHLRPISNPTGSDNPGASVYQVQHNVSRSSYERGPLATSPSDGPLAAHTLGNDKRARATRVSDDIRSSEQYVTGGETIAMKQPRYAVKFSSGHGSTTRRGEADIGRVSTISQRTQQVICSPAEKPEHQTFQVESPRVLDINCSSSSLAFPLSSTVKHTVPPRKTREWCSESRPEESQAIPEVV